MDWIWTDHIEKQLTERNISKNLAEFTLNNPDKIVIGSKNRKIYQKIFEKKLIRVVTEGDRLVTVYLTNKINKYMNGD